MESLKFYKQLFSITGNLEKSLKPQIAKGGAMIRLEISTDITAEMRKRDKFISGLLHVKIWCQIVTVKCRMFKGSI